MPTTLKDNPGLPCGCRGTNVEHLISMKWRIILSKFYAFATFAVIVLATLLKQ